MSDEMTVPEDLPLGISPIALKHVITQLSIWTKKKNDGIPNLFDDGSKEDTQYDPADWVKPMFKEFSELIQARDFQGLMQKIQEHASTYIDLASSGNEAYRKYHELFYAVPEDDDSIIGRAKKAHTVRTLDGEIDSFYKMISELPKDKQEEALRTLNAVIGEYIPEHITAENFSKIPVFIADTCKELAEGYYGNESNVFYEILGNFKKGFPDAAEYEQHCSKFASDTQSKVSEFLENTLTTEQGDISKQHYTCWSAIFNWAQGEPIPEKSVPDHERYVNAAFDNLAYIWDYSYDTAMPDELKTNVRKCCETAVANAIVEQKINLNNGVNSLRV